MWRHGDVLISAIEDIPKDAVDGKVDTLSWGGFSGRNHRFEDPQTAEMYEKDGELFIRVLADQARLINEEHVALTLFKGNYRFWFQREYSPEAIRRIFD
jgi:hypothetical protein